MIIINDKNINNIIKIKTQQFFKKIKSKKKIIRNILRIINNK